LERDSDPTLHSPGGEAIPDAFALDIEDGKGFDLIVE